MRSFFRNAIALIFLFASAQSLHGCGSKSDNATTTPTPTPTTPSHTFSCVTPEAYICTEYVIPDSVLTQAEASLSANCTGASAAGTTWNSAPCTRTNAVGSCDEDVPTANPSIIITIREVAYMSILAPGSQVSDVDWQTQVCDVIAGNSTWHLF